MQARMVRVATLLLFTFAVCAAVPHNVQKNVDSSGSWRWHDGISSVVSQWWSKEQTYGKKDVVCEDTDWRKTSMKLLHEVPAAGLYADLKGTTKWEISGMTTTPLDDKLYMIFDSLDLIGQVDERFEYMNPSNILIGYQGEFESGFEAIEYSHDTNTFLVVREAIEAVNKGGHKEGAETEYHPSILEVDIQGTGKGATYTVLRECPVDYIFDNGNKGFEGGAYFAKDGKRWFLGICEGNWCADGKEGRETGNGRMVLTSLQTNGSDCVWATEKVLKVPAEADFIDYADVSIRGDTIAIVSQESAAVWIGKIDTDAWEIYGPGDVYHFPRNPHCEIIYCNVEGIVFLDDYRIAAASDRAKEDQPYQCVPKDQSVMVFQLPTPITDPTNKAKKDL